MTTIEKPDLLPAEPVNDAAPPADAPRRFFSRDTVQQADDIKREWVDVPEWQGGCWVRGLTAVERSRLERTGMTEDGKVNPLAFDHFRIRLVILAAVDDDNKPLFKNTDLPMLEKKSIQAVERIADVASRLSAITAADVESLTGKSATTPNGASPTASPSIWDTPPST